jgi:chromate transporter
MIGLAAAAFVAIFFFAVPFPIIIFAAAIIGYVGGRQGHPAFEGGGGHGNADKVGLSDADSALGEHIPDHARPKAAWSLKIAAVFLALWIAPVIALAAWLGTDHVFSQIAVFFSKMAVVTFGGAYAVLAYVAQEAVQTFGWLKPGEMLDGLGMAETTPGPLIMVLQFVGSWVPSVIRGSFRRW